MAAMYKASFGSRGDRPDSESVQIAGCSVRNVIVNGREGITKSGGGYGHEERDSHLSGSAFANDGLRKIDAVQALSFAALLVFASSRIVFQMALVEVTKGVRLAILLVAVLSVQAQQGIIDPPELTGKPTTPRKEPDEVMVAFITNISRGGNRTAELMPIVSQFLQAHPSFGDGYGFRVLGQYCELHQPASDALLDDLNKAISYFSPDGFIEKQTELYGMRARLEYDLGRFQAAVDDIEKGIRLSPSDADRVVKVGGVRPSTRATESDQCAWTQTEFDNLSKLFPKDHRISLYRGLYLSKLSSYATEGGAALVPKAIAEYQKSLTINPRSALAHYFIGRLYSNSTFWDPRAITNSDVRATGLRRAIAEYAIAITLDPKLKDAYADRAGHYLELKQYALAVRDFDRALELDPGDAGLYHDRGLAKEDKGEPLAALIDFDHAIRLDTLSDSALPEAYKNRGDAHMKVEHYKEAAADFTQLIKLRLSAQVFIVPLSRLRAIYPEYAALADNVFLKKFHDLFDPRYDEKQFAKQITENRPRPDFLLAEAYERRTDAYLKDNRYRKAVSDYQRAVSATDNEGKFVERWRSLWTMGKGEQLLDMNSLTFGTNPSLWIKKTKPRGYELELLDFDCKNRKLRSINSVTYDENGGVVKSLGGNGVFQTIVPATFGESLLRGMCRID